MFKYDPPHNPIKNRNITGKHVMDGIEKYYMNGHLHKRNGPAIVYSPEWKEMGFIDGYFIHGRQYWTLDSFLEDATSDEEERIYLKLKLKDKFVE